MYYITNAITGEFVAKGCISQRALKATDKIEEAATFKSVSEASEVSQNFDCQWEVTSFGQGF